MSKLENLTDDLILYGVANPGEFAMINGWTLDTSQWTQSQREGYLAWALEEGSKFKADTPGLVEKVVHPADSVSAEWSGRAEVDSVINEFFGPGSYRDGYTGAGDAIYWGAQDAGSSNRTSLSTESSSEMSSIGSQSTIPRGQVAREMLFRSGVDSAIESASAYSQYSGETGEMARGIGAEVTRPVPDVFFPSFSESSYPTMPSVSDYVPTELPDNLVGLKNAITPFETQGASAWKMGSQMQSPSYVSSLEDLPDIPNLDANMLTQLGIPKEDMGKILNDSYQSTNAEGVGSYNLNRFVNGVVGAAVNVAVIGPLLNWVRDNLGVVGQGVFGTVNIIGAANMFGLIGDFDPVGLAVQTALFGINAYNDQSRRKRNNDYSGKLDSSRAMMVRDNGKWYPAFLVNRTEDESLLFPGTDYIDVRYGRPEDLYFVQEAGQTKAFFKNQKNRQFRMDPETFTTDRGSYDWLKEKDPLRSFYFLSPDETEGLLQGYGTQDFAWKVLDDETAESRGGNQDVRATVRT